MNSIRRNSNDLKIKDISSSEYHLSIGNNIILYDIDSIKNYINNIFNTKYNELLKRIDNIDDDSDGDSLYIEFDYLMNIIMNKYSKYLSNIEVVNYGKKLINLRVKLLDILNSRCR